MDPNVRVSPEKLFNNLSNNSGISPLSVLQDVQKRIIPPISVQCAQSPQEPVSFPLEGFPLKLQELITGAEKALGMPVDFLSAACLQAAAIAMGGTYALEVKQGQEQRPIFWIALVGKPNTNKSGPVQFALDPIDRKDSEQYKQYEQKKSEFDRLSRMSQKELDDSGVFEIPEKPIYRRSLVRDTTIEGLVSVHQRNPRGIGVFRDELIGWLKDFGRYSSGSGETENWLSSWNGSTVTIDRKHAEPIRIDCPHIAVIGTVQPDVLDELIKNGRSGNGFIDRFLFVWPEHLEKPVWTDLQINRPLKEAYVTAIDKLLDLNPNPDSLRLSDEAKRRLYRFFNEENKILCDRCEDGQLAGVYGKFDIHTIRLTIVYHMLWWAYSDERAPSMIVSIQSVERAIEAARYFRRQAERVFNRLHNHSPLDLLTETERKLYDALPETFKNGVGLETAENMSSKSTYARLLRKRDVIKKTSRGEYYKLL